MKRILPIIGVLFVSSVALAVPAPKVFVCKYVGTPGVNETLQTGQNPISVSQNSIKDFQGIGSSFNDAQGRSLVVALDTGQDQTCPTDNPVPSSNPQSNPTPNPQSSSTPTPTTLPEVGASGL